MSHIIARVTYSIDRRQKACEVSANHSRENFVRYFFICFKLLLCWPSEQSMRREKKHMKIERYLLSFQREDEVQNTDKTHTREKKENKRTLNNIYIDNNQVILFIIFII